MKKICTLILSVSTLLPLGLFAKAINPIIGDQSFIMKFGVAPTDATDDHLRILTHLQYAEFVLRSKDVSQLSDAQITKRNHLLDLLHAYWSRGVFPRNDDHLDERKPCFIDHEGTICAVGYLIEQTAGHDAAEEISERFLYGEILDMNDPLVINWIEESGLTKEECAIIQPSYRTFFKPTNRLSYGVSYRINDDFYHTIRFERQSKKQANFGNGSSYGVQFDWLKHGAFSAGVLYSLPVPAKRFTHIVRSVEIMPEYFQYGVYSGINLRPGFQLTRTWNRLSMRFGYSYCIPILNESSYEAGRHDLTFRMGYNLTGLRLPKFPRKPKEPDAADRPDAWKD